MQAANKAPYLEMSRLGALAKLATSGNHIKRPKAASPSATTEVGQFQYLRPTKKQNPKAISLGVLICVPTQRARVCVTRPRDWEALVFREPRAGCPSQSRECTMHVSRDAAPSGLAFGFRRALLKIFLVKFVLDIARYWGVLREFHRELTFTLSRRTQSVE